MARLRYKSDSELEKKDSDFHHNVYVILLDPKVARHPTILRINPKRDPAKPCVYVGMSGLPPEHRFENHKHGYKAAWVVEKYGVRLMPELYEHLNPMPSDSALSFAKAFDRLRGPSNARCRISFHGRMRRSAMKTFTRA